MPGNNIVLVDSDGLIGLINQEDPHHSKCLQISVFLTKNNLNTAVPYLIALEAATTFSRKINRPDLATIVLEQNSRIKEKVLLDEDITEEVVQSFSKNTSRKNTPFDHYLLALAKKNSIKYIFSFDTFYKKQGLLLAEDLLKK